MSDADNPSFPGFGKLVPGFDFLQNLAKQAAGSATQSIPQLPNLGNWVAPTLNVEELDKRIEELKAVQFWLDQNATALKATIQALEVQKMTLSTLRGMNVRMEDIASAFTRQAAAMAPAPAPAAAAAPEPELEEIEEEDEAPEEEAPAPSRPRRKPAAAKAKAGSTDGAGVVDPMQWWGSLTEQFQQIASTALQDAAQLKVPAMAQPLADAVGSVIGSKPAAARKPAPAAKKAAAPVAKKKASTAARKRTSARR